MQAHNTYYPSDEELNPDTGDEESTESESIGTSESDKKKGCFGSVSASSLVWLVALAGVALLRKKED